MSHVLYIDVDYYNVLFLMFVLWLVIILIRTTTVREDPRKAPTRKKIPLHVSLWTKAAAQGDEHMPSSHSNCSKRKRKEMKKNKKRRKSKPH